MRPLIWLLAAPRVVRETAELPLAPVLVIANHVTAYDGALILVRSAGKDCGDGLRLQCRVRCCWTFDSGRNQQSTLSATCWRLLRTGW